MGSTSLVVLQALVLHLLSVRDMYEPRAVWSLTGVAVRIAQSMGLERDGVSLCLPPFESEMRRRIWWLLKTHDFQTAELCGLAKFRDLVTGADNTKWPTNVNDDQLYPGMSLPPAESHTLTDMVFVALRYELTNFTACSIAKFRRQGENSSQSVLCALSNDTSGMYNAIKDFEEILETKYLRYCDPSQPLHLTTMLVGRLALNFIRFVMHHPRKWASTEQTPLSERQMVWEISIKLLEQHNMAQSNPQLKQFAWHAAYYQQWHALIHVLDSLRADPLIAKADKAWQIIGNIYENTPDMVFDNRKPIHVAVGKLCLKAYGDREAALKCENMYTPSTPDFILQLREKYEVAKAKRQAGGAKSRQPGGLISHSHEKDGELGPKPDANFIRPTDNLEFTDAQQSITTDPPNLNQKGATTDYDPFWLINGFDDSHIGGLDDVMNMDPDVVPAQHHGLEDNATQTITWDQWDAWLADSNVMRPLSSTWDSRTGT